MIKKVLSHSLSILILAASHVYMPLCIYADTNATALDEIKINKLKERKAELKAKIEVEDKKRNQSLQGVSPATQERLNNQQDSICLELRSELVSVELQIAELSPSTTIVTIPIQSNIQQQQSQDVKQ